MIEGKEEEVGRGIEEEDLEVEALQGLEVDQAPEERVEEEEVTIEEEDLPGLIVEATETKRGHIAQKEVEEVEEIAEV